MIEKCRKLPSLLLTAMIQAFAGAVHRKHAQCAN
jgi:hypothetical protein